MQVIIVAMGAKCCKEEVGLNDQTEQQADAQKDLHSETQPIGKPMDASYQYKENTGDSKEIDQQKAEPVPSISEEGAPESVINVEEEGKAESTEVGTNVEEKTEEGKAKTESSSKLTLTPARITAVQKSWVSVEALGAETVGVLLFKNIFEIHPPAVQLFSFKNEPGMMKSAKLKAHGKKVVDTVGVAVGALTNLPALVPILQGLALKHINFNINPQGTPEHKSYYDVVGQALLKTLEMGLADAFTPALRESWALVYGIVSETMCAVTADFIVPEAQLQGA